MLRTFKSRTASGPAALRFRRMVRRSPVGILDSTIRVRDVGSGRVLRKLEGHTSWVLSVAFSPDGQTARQWGFGQTRFVCGMQRVVGICGRLKDIRIGSTALHIHRMVGHSPVEVRTARFVCGMQRGVGICGRLNGHTGAVRSVAYSPDGRALASGSWDGTMLIWELMPAATPEPEATSTPADRESTLEPEATSIPG